MQVTQTDEKSTMKPELNLQSVVNAIARDIESVLSPGDIAELRRMKPGEFGGPAFWKLAAAHLEPAGLLPTAGEQAEAAAERWAAILAGMAMTRGFHHPGARLGRALADAGLSEGRFLALLRSHDRQLLDAVRLTAHYLATKAVPVDWADYAWLVISDGTAGEEAVRRRIARDYYRSQAAKK